MIDTISMIQSRLAVAFESLGYDPKLATVKNSDRPDLGDLQCTAAMKIAGVTKQKSVEIANKIVAAMTDQEIFSTISVSGPGFINFTLSNEYLEKRLNTIQREDRARLVAANPQRIVIDYGGPNVAKPLHVGHLRSAIVGDSIKRIAKYLGHTVISDVHLGDWGTPMGMLLAALKDEHPNWPYFSGAETYPDSSLITVEDLNALYPQASTRFKNDPKFAEKAREATIALQNGHPGYRALWEQFIKISVQSVKSDYDRLGVSFDLWLGESDAAKYVKQAEEIFKGKGLLTESQGAQVIEVSKPNDHKTVPPLIFRKEDGGLTYATTDLATILLRNKTFSPDSILYVVDQRQGLHFEQVFRAAYAAGLAQEGSLEHVGFGTLNGRDGRPFKTRQGGVMRLTSLIDVATAGAMQRVVGSTEKSSEEIQEMVKDISVAAIKFSDLSVQRQANYVFDVASFVQTKGKTGAYLQYAAVRIRSLLTKAKIKSSLGVEIKIASASERALTIVLDGFHDAVNAAFIKRKPSEICDYVYELAVAYNRFYEECPILKADSDLGKMSRLALSQTVLGVLEKSLDLLGIKAPHQMISYSPPHDDSNEQKQAVPEERHTGCENLVASALPTSKPKSSLVEDGANNSTRRIARELRKVAFLQSMPKKFSFEGDVSATLLHGSLGGFPPETIEFLEGGSHDTKLYFGTGVNTPSKLSKGVDLSFIPFQRAAIEVAGIFRASVLQDVCDVMPMPGLGALADCSGLDHQQIRNTLVSFSNQLRDFSHRAHRGLNHDVSYEACLVSDIRKTYPDAHDDVTQTANRLLSEFLKAGATACTNLQPYTLPVHLVGELRTQDSGYLGQQIADMWLMRKHKSVVLKLGWAALNERDFHSNGRLHVPGRSELYFDYYYRAVEAKLDAEYRLQGLPPMGFLYSKPSRQFDGKRYSPYFFSNAPSGLACMNYGDPTYDVSGIEDLDGKFTALAEAHRPRVARSFVANLLGLDRSGTWKTRNEWERFLDRIYDPMLKMHEALNTSSCPKMAIRSEPCGRQLLSSLDAV